MPFFASKQNSCASRLASLSGHPSVGSVVCVGAHLPPFHSFAHRLLSPQHLPLLANSTLFCLSAFLPDCLAFCVLAFLSLLYGLCGLYVDSPLHLISISFVRSQATISLTSSHFPRRPSAWALWLGRTPRSASPSCSKAQRCVCVLHQGACHHHDCLSHEAFRVLSGGHSLSFVSIFFFFCSRAQKCVALCRTLLPCTHSCVCVCMCVGGACVWPAWNNAAEKQRGRADKHAQLRAA